MLTELIILRHLYAVLHSRWEALRADPEGGYTTETVIVTALLAPGHPHAAGRTGACSGGANVARSQPSWSSPRRSFCC